VNFGLAHSGKFGQGDARQIGDLVFEIFGQFLDGRFGRFTINGQVDDFGSPGKLPNHGFFCLIREGGNAIHLSLYFVQEGLQVPALHDLYDDGAVSFPGRGIDSFDAGQSCYVFFDLLDDALFHLCWRSAYIFGGDGDTVHGKLREDLQFHGSRCFGAGQQYKDHQQIGCHVIFGKPGNKAPHDLSPSFDEASRTTIPSVTAFSIVTTTDSPPSSPEIMRMLSP